MCSVQLNTESPHRIYKPTHSCTTTNVPTPATRSKSPMSPANVGPHVTGQTSSTVAQRLIKVQMSVLSSALHYLHKQF